MRSFRTELEDPIVQQDIIELEKKIRLFKTGKLDEDRFKTLRLARGIYGQRQPGVQMIRIKLPYGKVTAQQLRRISDVSEEYSTGRLHITTRQDIQIHYVSLDRTPELWAELERDDITLREACGNTVRNITASTFSGIDKDEAFDVRPYAEAVFKSFLRNPICQEMGRKIKISFSNSEKDTALSFMHDLGFIAKVRDGVVGFKVLVAGGLGSQSRQADVLYEFLETDKIIPVVEAVLRIFERRGERSNRMKARLKFLVKDLGFETFQELFLQELATLKTTSIPIHYEEAVIAQPKSTEIVELKSSDTESFEIWKESNVYPQKQNDLFAIGVKVRIGDFRIEQARVIADAIELFTGNELTLTIDQNLLIRHVAYAQLPRFYYLLKELDLADLGFGSSVDVTACPGTDTCNLGIANSTSLSNVIEELLVTEYPSYQFNDKLSIKISGCMNSCGQHMIASIGFQGMSIQTKDKRVIPAIQILLGGGRLGNGEGRIADKVIKIPSKRVKEAMRLIMDGFEAAPEDDFLAYYDSKGEKFFYDLLKPLTDIETILDSEFIDWGQDELYKKEIGVGECAGIVIDLVSTLFKESEEKLALATASLDNNAISDGVFHAYSSIVNTSKALLLSENKKTNSQLSIIEAFDETFIQSGLISFDGDYKTWVTRHAQPFPSTDEALNYLNQANAFYANVLMYRENQLKHALN